MADAGQIATVRALTNEPTTDVYTDDAIASLIDATTSVNLASASIWDQKAAKYADLVDVSEAGASRKMGDLFNHAKERAAYFRKLGEADVGIDVNANRAKVHVINRVS